MKLKALMEEELANLRIADEEEDLVCDPDKTEEVKEEFKLCLVGKVLTNGAVHFPSMRSVLAELLHPIEGVSITDLEDKRVLFRLYNELDLWRVTNGIPWFFNRHLILFHRLEKGEDPMMVTLFYTNFWVQIHNLPIGSMSVGMANRLGDFIGKFLEYDTSIIAKGVKRDMRIKVCLDV